MRPDGVPSVAATLGDPGWQGAKSENIGNI